MSKNPTEIPGKISKLLSPATIKLDVAARQKIGALREVAQLLAANPLITNFDAFFQEIIERERASNTALGHDVAIPHARTDHCTDIVMAVGRSTEGIDFEAKDGAPVRLMFMMGTPKNKVAEYLRIVGSLARLLRQDAVREALLAAPDAASFIRVLEQAES